MKIAELKEEYKKALIEVANNYNPLHHRDVIMFNSELIRIKDSYIEKLEKLIEGK